MGIDAATPARRAPLPRTEFARALRFGLGRARIDVRRHGLRGREDLLVAACLRDATRIRMLEGSPAAWLVAIARDGGALAVVSRAVRRAAARPIRRGKDCGHVARVLEELVLAGDTAARRSLLGMLRRARDEDLVEVGIPVVRALGADGWREVVATILRRRRIVEWVDLHELALVARRVVGVRRALAALPTDARADASPFPEAMRGAIRETGGRPSRWEPKDEPASTLYGLERLVGSASRHPLGLRRWAALARPEDRDEAWRRVRAEKDPERLRRRLVAMRSERRLRPGLFEFAAHGDPWVRRAAIDVLSEVRDVRVRRWALVALRRDPRGALRDDVLYALELNGRPADAAAIAAALPPKRSDEPDDAWVRGVLHAARPIQPPSREVPQRTGPAWDALLVRAYDIAPCRDCRKYVLETLAERRSAPEWMLREALWDSQSETRSIARRALRAAGTRRRQR